MCLQSSIMSQISRKKSFGKVVFPFLVRNFMSRNRNCFFFFFFFCRHFVIVYPIFDFFAEFWFFGLLYQWPAFHRQIHSGKYFSELGSFTTNGSAEGLDHLSVNSHDRISISVTKYIQKNKNISVILYFTRTRKLNGVFPILSLKVDHLDTFVKKKPNFNIWCLLGPTWNWNVKLKLLCFYLFDKEAVLLSYDYTKPGRP